MLKMLIFLTKLVWIFLLPFILIPLIPELSAQLSLWIYCVVASDKGSAQGSKENCHP